MRCEVCGCEVADPVESAVRMAQAAKSAPLLDWWVDEYHEGFGLPITRTDVRRLLELLNGYVTLCPDCRARLAVGKPRGPAEEAPTAGAPAVAAADAPQLVRQLLRHATEEEATAARQALAAMGSECLPAFEAALDPKSSLIDDERRTLFLVLGRLGPEMAPLLAKYLVHPQLDIRRGALSALEVCPTEACAEAAAALMADPVRDLRRAAVVVLGRVGGPTAVTALTAALGDSTAEVRAAAMWGLVRLGQGAPVESVVEAAAKSGERWLGAALLQLCGKSRQETMALLAAKGFRIQLAPDAADTAGQAYQRGRQLLSEGSLEAAEEALQQASWELPFEVGPLAALAQCRSQRKQWAEAAQTVERLIALEPFSARWHHNLGVVMLQLGMQTAAVEQLAQAVLLDSTYAAAPQALARLGITEPGLPSKACVAHPTRDAADRCVACRVPLCPECGYAGPQGLHCERHVPPVPEENRRQAQALLTEARVNLGYLEAELMPEKAEADEYGRNLLWGSRAAVLGLGVGAAVGFAAAHALSSAEAEARLRGWASAASRALESALSFDPTCEEAALALADLTILCEGTGHPALAPRSLATWGFQTCASYGPTALAARFFARCDAGCEAALWDYFSRLARSPSAWSPATIRVIDSAVDRGFAPQLGPYLRTLLARLPRHSLERRQCRNLLRGLEGH